MGFYDLRFLKKFTFSSVTCIFILFVKSVMIRVGSARGPWERKTSSSGQSRGDDDDKKKQVYFSNTNLIPTCFGDSLLRVGS